MSLARSFRSSPRKLNARSYDRVGKAAYVSYRSLMHGDAEGSQASSMPMSSPAPVPIAPGTPLQQVASASTPGRLDSPGMRTLARGNVPGPLGAGGEAATASPASRPGSSKHLTAVSVSEGTTARPGTSAMLAAARAAGASAVSAAPSSKAPVTPARTSGRMTVSALASTGKVGTPGQESPAKAASIPAQGRGDMYDLRSAPPSIYSPYSNTLAQGGAAPAPAQPQPDVQTVAAEQATGVVAATAAASPTTPAQAPAPVAAPAAASPPQTPPHTSPAAEQGSGQQLVLAPAPAPVPQRHAVVSVPVAWTGEGWEVLPPEAGQHALQLEDLGGEGEGGPALGPEGEPAPGTIVLVPVPADSAIALGQILLPCGTVQDGEELWTPFGQAPPSLQGGGPDASPRGMDPAVAQEMAAMRSQLALVTNALTSLQASMHRPRTHTLSTASSAASEGSSPTSAPDSEGASRRSPSLPRSVGPQATSERGGHSPSQNMDHQDGVFRVRGASAPHGSSDRAGQAHHMPGLKVTTEHSGVHAHQPHPQQQQQHQPPHGQQGGPYTGPDGYPQQHQQHQPPHGQQWPAQTQAHARPAYGRGHFGSFGPLGSPPAMPRGRVDRDGVLRMGDEAGSMSHVRPQIALRGGSPEHRQQGAPGAAGPSAGQYVHGMRISRESDEESVGSSDSDSSAGQSFSDEPSFARRPETYSGQFHARRQLQQAGESAPPTPVGGSPSATRQLPVVGVEQQKGAAFVWHDVNSQGPTVPFPERGAPESPEALPTPGAFSQPGVTPVRPLPVEDVTPPPASHTPGDTQHAAPQPTASASEHPYLATARAREEQLARQQAAYDEAYEAYMRQYLQQTSGASLPPHARQALGSVPLPQAHAEPPPPPRRRERGARKKAEREAQAPAPPVFAYPRSASQAGRSRVTEAAEAAAVRAFGSPEFAPHGSRGGEGGRGESPASARAGALRVTDEEYGRIVNRLHHTHTSASATRRAASPRAGTGTGKYGPRRTGPASRPHGAGERLAAAREMTAETDRAAAAYRSRIRAAAEGKADY